jgi:hypothetical protein
MLVKVKSMIGKEMEFDVLETDTVFSLKEKVAVEISLTVDQFKFFLNGRPLRDDGTFIDQGVKPGSVLQIGHCSRG